MLFSGSDNEVVYILFSVNIHIGKDMDSGRYYYDMLD